MLVYFIKIPRKSSKKDAENIFYIDKKASNEIKINEKAVCLQRISEQNANSTIMNNLIEHSIKKREENRKKEMKKNNVH